MREWLDSVENATQVLTHDGSKISYNDKVLHLLVGPGKDRTFTSAFLRSVGFPDVFEKGAQWYTKSVSSWDAGPLYAVTVDGFNTFVDNDNFKTAKSALKGLICRVDHVGSESLLLRNYANTHVAILREVDL